MKRIYFILVIGLAVAFSGCNNKDEKRIAELESRLAELETKNSGTPNSPAAVQAQQAQPEVKPEGPLPKFTFEKTEHDFGTINEGDVVEHVFKFTNTGDAPLIIQSASGSCGCTVPAYSKEPVAPGESGEIVAKFDSKNQKNLQNKTVTVTANTWPKQTMLKIRARVTPEATTQSSSGPVRQ